MLDVIIPVFNENENLDKLYEELTKTLKDIKYTLIFIDDGSNDKSLNTLANIYSKDKRHVRVISFSRNFGKDAAMYAGLKESKSKYACIIDSDLQQKPKLILDMLKFLEENQDFDEVAMVNDYTKENIFQKLFKKIFYSIMKKSTKQEYVAGASDFRLMRDYVVESLVSMKENNRFTKGLFSWVGFRIHYMKYKPDKRYSGKTKFSFKKQISYALDGIMSFSVSPLRFATYLGSFISIGSFIYLIVLIIKTLVTGKDVPGYASLMSIILLLGGIQILLIGIIGRYIAKTYIETKNRPIYVAKKRFGFEDDIL